VEFRTKNYYEVKTKVTYDHINILYSTETKFWGLIIDETLSWNQHIDQIATKLCSASYALRNLKILYLSLHYEQYITLIYIPL